MSALASRPTHLVVACARAATLLAAATSLLLAFLSARPGERVAVWEPEVTVATIATEPAAPARRGLSPCVSRPAWRSRTS